jgi:RNA-directed DNA polymerase
MALRRLRNGMLQHWVRYVVEVDVVGYFDHVNHEWLRKFLRHRANDGGLLRLIDTWLKAGVMENGVVTLNEDRVPQGGPVSPVLANVYLHYVLDLWFERRFKKNCRRWTELTRYADDFVAAFQDREDAERFREEVEERLAAFELHVAPEKTAVLRFNGSLFAWDGSTSDQTGDLYLPWFQALPDENAPRVDQHRPNGEHQSPRAIPSAAGRLAASESSS